jgi:CMP-N,N'-diacetyllegionaminic acid synthase
MPSVFVLIPARGGSKTLPRKNIRPMAGKPMIAWSIEAAKNSRQVQRVFLSTDDEEIAAIGAAAGAEVPFLRPAHLASDTASTFSVLAHFVEWCRANQLRPDYFMVLQPTSPLRITADIDAAVELARERRAGVVVSVSELWQHMSHPWNVRRLAADGTLRPYLGGNLPSVSRHRLPPAYVLNGAIYVYDAVRFDTIKESVPPDAAGFVMPPERSIDVDTAIEFKIAELLLQHSL